MSDLTYKVTGAGAKGGPSKKMIIFTVNLKQNGADIKDSKKDDLVVHIEGPEEDVPKTIISGGDKGVFHIGFTPTDPGQHWVDFVYKGKFADAPYLLSIKDFNKCPEVDYKGKARTASGAPPARKLSAGAQLKPVEVLARRLSTGEDDEKKRKDDEEKKKKEEEDRKKAEEEAIKKKEEEEKKKKETEEKKKEEEDRKKKEEEDRKKKEVEDKKKKDDEDKKKKEEEDRKKKEAEEKKKEEEDKKRKEEEDKKKKETEERKKKEEEDKKKKDEEDRKKKEAEDRKKKDEEDRKKKEAEDKKKKEEEEEERKKKREEEEKRKDDERDRLELERKEKQKRAQERLAQKKKQKEEDAGASTASVISMSVRFQAVNRNGESKLEGGDASEFKAFANGFEVTKIEDMAGGLYSFDCQCVPGSNKIDVQFRGQSIKGFPITFNKKTEAELQQERAKLEEEEKRADEAEEKEISKSATENKAGGAVKPKPLSEAEKKMIELEEKKKAMAEKQAELAAKKTQTEQKKAAVTSTTPAPKKPEPAATATKGTVASRVGQAKKEEEKPVTEAKPPVKSPSKLASAWEQKSVANAAPPVSAARSELEGLKSMTKAQAQPSGGSSGGSLSEFTNESSEIEVLLRFVNDALKGEKNARDLPLNADNPEKLFQSLSDGINMCYFFDKMIPNLLDVRVITRRVTDKRDKIDNWNLCVNTAKAAACRLSDVKPDALADGNGAQIQKVMWEIIRVSQETEIRILDSYLKSVVPELTDDNISGWPIDKLLLAWVNQLLKNRSQSRTAKAFPADFKDCFFYVELCDEILANGGDLQEETDQLLKAEGVIMLAEEFGKGPHATAEGIVAGSYWQNFLLLSTFLLNAASLA